MTVEIEDLSVLERGSTPREAVGGAGAPTTCVIVNGRRHVIPASEIDHAAVVALAFPAGADASFAVTFRGGPAERPSGFLVPGHGARIVEDQVFHVAAAVQS